MGIFGDSVTTDHISPAGSIKIDGPAGNYLKKNKSEELFNEFWNPESNSEVYHFIGKDIMYFHTLFFPVMLSESNLKTPNGVFVHGFLTLNGDKMSKSRGNFISAENYINTMVSFTWI